MATLRRAMRPLQHRHRGHQLLLRSMRRTQPGETRGGRFRSTWATMPKHQGLSWKTSDLRRRTARRPLYPRQRNWPLPPLQPARRPRYEACRKSGILRLLEGATIPLRPYAQQLRKRSRAQPCGNAWAIISLNRRGSGSLYIASRRRPWQSQTAEAQLILRGHR